MGSAVISKNGETLYYFSAFEDKYDLWKMDLRKKETKLLHKMNTGWANMEMDKEGKNLFLLGSNSMQKIGYGIGETNTDSLPSELKMDLAAEREYMFDHVYKQERKTVLQREHARRKLGRYDRRLP